MKNLLRFVPIATMAATIMAASPPPAMPVSPVATALVGSTEPAKSAGAVVATIDAGYTNAPVPNTDATIPFVKDPSKDQAQLGPGVFAPPATGYRGEGYTPGSSVDGEQQRKVKPGGGISLKVPLN
jgi:hypothetical protein